MKAWYCLRTKHKKEESAAATLEAGHYLSYCPLTLTDKRKKSLITTHATFAPITEPLLPRYIFVQMDEGKDDFYPITKTPGIVSIVKMTRRNDGCLYPTPMRDGVIQELRDLEDEQGIHSRHQADYQEGDEIQVVRGPFNNYKAKFSNKSGDDRALVFMETVGSFRKIELDYRDIEPVST